MKDSITSLYRQGLEQYFIEHRNSPAQYLIEELSKVSTLETLINVFAIYLKSEKAPYETIAFNTQVSEWKKKLEKIQSDQPKVLVALNEIPITHQNKSLLLLLKEILSDPQLLLHSHMPYLLRILCDYPMSTLINYILKVPSAPKKSSQDLSQEPKSQQHQACLILANNLAMSSNPKDPLWNTSSIMLEIALLMYQELAFFEISLDEEINISRSCCPIPT